MTRQSRHLRKRVAHGSSPVEEACGKIRYRSREAAEHMMAKIAATGNPDRPKTEQRAYECAACKWWHLTSSPEQWPGQEAAS